MATPKLSVQHSLEAELYFAAWCRERVQRMEEQVVSARDLIQKTRIMTDRAADMRNSLHTF